MNEKLIVWLYARSARNEDGALERQITRLKTYAAQKGYQIAGSSQDEASGLNFDRDGLNIVKTVAATGKINTVLVTDVARIGKDMAKVTDFVEMLKNYRVDIVTMDGNMLGIEDIRNGLIPLFFGSKTHKKPVIAPDINGKFKEWFSAYDVAEILGIIGMKTGLPSAEAVEAIISQLNMKPIEGIDYVKNIRRES